MGVHECVVENAHVGDGINDARLSQKCIHVKLGILMLLVRNVSV